VRNDTGGAEVLTVNDDFPRALECTWVCTLEDPAGGPAVTEQGEGSIEGLGISVPSGATVVIDATCRVHDTPDGILVNRVFVADGSGGVVSATAVAAVSTPAAIPALSSALLVVLGVLLAVAGAIRLRRRGERAA
jgi:hypothetical protein